MNDRDPSLLEPPPGSKMRDPDFRWGVATSSFQIEGAAKEDNRLQSIWDVFCATPGKILSGEDYGAACDHYERWAADVDLIASLGVDAYRLSIAWPRVMDERGRPNPAGFDFYKRLLDRLQERGIERFVTLYHWDLPQYLEYRGGWLNRDLAYRFADYADLASRVLAGRVTAWATLNEPWCSAYLGYGNGHHAPGLADVRYATQAMHHLLLGHGLAVPALRANDPTTPRGIVANVCAASTDRDGDDDRDAAHLCGVFLNDWVLQPLLAGGYPEDLFRLWPQARPVVVPGDLERIATPIDYLGINYYFRTNVRSDRGHGFVEAPLAGVERTELGWEVFPQGLEDLLRQFKDRYPKLPPIYITENGIAATEKAGDGRIDDPVRVSYLARHIAAVSRAIDAGVDVRGYFVWSLMDNFEWAFGYRPRFGLVHVDYATQTRTLKQSALAYQAFLAARDQRTSRRSVAAPLAS
jgi:beta-glucosidase